MISLPIPNEIVNEFLTPDEVRELTGSPQLKKQMSWLQDKEWQFELNHRNQILISRWYLRLKMSGISLAVIPVANQAEPNFKVVR